MSKGKPIKLSSTPFVFYAQSSKVGERSYFLGMGKVWRSNSNLGSHPFLENVFLDSSFFFVNKTCITLQKRDYTMIYI